MLAKVAAAAVGDNEGYLPLSAAGLSLEACGVASSRGARGAGKNDVI